MPGPTTSDLIFSEQANHKFSKTLSDLKRSTLSIHNRLRSIKQDAVFAQSVADAFGKPLIANERCGSWYIDPRQKGGSAYFKSTDGHTGVWKLSTRRLNLQLLKIIGSNDGCIIVDSTRRGKRMPDALSKTIPIWCCVLNRLLFPTLAAAHDLYTPPHVVSQSEHAQITALIPSFLASIQTLSLPLDSLRLQISNPLRPIWVTPDSDLTQIETSLHNSHSIICCTVSRRVAGGENSEGGYIQGAGDDTENWAHGLNPSIFWANQALLLSTSERDLPVTIENLIQDSAKIGSATSFVCVEPTTSMFVGLLGSVNLNPETCIITLLPKASDESTWLVSPMRLDVGLGPHKIGSRNLRTALPTIVAFARKNLVAIKGQESATFRMIVACEDGKDLSIGVSLVLLCLLFADDGTILSEDYKSLMIDKTFIRRRLGWISTSKPEANPSRSTLQSVNSFLMERP